MLRPLVKHENSTNSVYITDKDRHTVETLDMAIAFTPDSRITAELDGARVSVGGEGEPSAFDLFLAGIGTCSAVKVQRFCQERGIPTADISLTQRMHYNPEANRFEKIELLIHLPEDFPARYHAAVIRAAETCGVKKHILNPPAFETLIAGVTPAAQPADSTG